MSPQRFKISRLVRLEAVNYNQFGCTVDIHSNVSRHVEVCTKLVRVDLLQ